MTSNVMVDPHQMKTFHVFTQPRPGTVLRFSGNFILNQVRHCRSDLRLPSEYASNPLVVTNSTLCTEKLCNMYNLSILCFRDLKQIPFGDEPPTRNLLVAYIVIRRGIGSLPPH